MSDANTAGLHRENEIGYEAMQIINEQSSRIADLLERIRVMRDQAAGNVWFWGDDEEDHIESLTCPIVIRPEVLRKYLAELKAARETISRLPKTADGVPIVPGMNVYKTRLTEPGVTVGWKVTSYALSHAENNAYDPIDPAFAYSTRKAALASAPAPA